MVGRGELNSDRWLQKLSRRKFSDPDNPNTDKEFDFTTFLKREEEKANKIDKIINREIAKVGFEAEPDFVEKVREAGKKNRFVRGTVRKWRTKVEPK